MARGVGSYLRKGYRESVMDETCCFWCGQTEGVFHVDHIVALGIGGNSSRDNLVKACARCNASKSDRTLLNWLEHSIVKRDKLRQQTNTYLWRLEKARRRQSSFENRLWLGQKIFDGRLEHSRLSKRIGTLIKLLHG